MRLRFSHTRAIALNLLTLAAGVLAVAGAAAYILAAT